MVSLRIEASDCVFQAKLANEIKVDPDDGYGMVSNEAPSTVGDCDTSELRMDDGGIPTSASPGSWPGMIADRTSSTQWWTNQWRLILSGFAYTLFEHLRVHLKKIHPSSA